jgi:hypothetical protein
MKVFVGKKFNTKLYIHGDNKGVSLVTSDWIAPDVLDYLEQHLPKLTAEEAAQVKNDFCIEAL